MTFDSLTAGLRALARKRRTARAATGLAETHLTLEGLAVLSFYLDRGS
jgi:hypothetical protein